MPRRKASRAPSRAKPIAPRDCDAVPDIEAELREKKMELLLQDFDAQVERRIAEMEKELVNVQEFIQRMYKADLNRYSTSTRSMLWKDYIKENKTAKSAMRESVANILSSADDLLTGALKKKGRTKTKANTSKAAPPSATRSSTLSKRERTVLGNNQTDNMQPPPSTVRAPRSRKMNLEVAATPANQGISANHLSSMIVTPKFDPRTPLPPGTVKRNPKFGEIAISLSGSPLQVSPKGWISTLSAEVMDEKTRAELIMFHESVGKLLNR